MVAAWLTHEVRNWRKFLTVTIAGPNNFAELPIVKKEGAKRPAVSSFGLEPIQITPRNPKILGDLLFSLTKA
jgi:hypothetical protein